MSSTRERHQHLDRSQVELRDQHQRVWLVASEMGLDFHRRPRMATVGSFMPQFQAPYDFYPDQKYLVFDPRRPAQVSINYNAWLSDQRARHQEVKDYLSQLAWSIYKDQAPRFIAEPTPEMLEIVYGRGKGPEPWEPILAAMQKNGWILGLRPFDAERAGDVRLKPFLERWAEVRYRDVRRWDAGEDVPEGLMFGDEEAEEPEAELVPDLGEDFSDEE